MDVCMGSKEYLGIIVSITDWFIIKWGWVHVKADVLDNIKWWVHKINDNIKRCMSEYAIVADLVKLSLSGYWRLLKVWPFLSHIF